MRRFDRWNMVKVVIGIIAGTALSHVVFSCVAKPNGQTVCHPAEAHSTAVWYVPAGHNTAVTLIAHCDGIPPTAWSISFFEGEQPDLQEWREAQDAASELLRG